MSRKFRDEAALWAIHREFNDQQLTYSIPEIFGENLFDVTTSSQIPEGLRQELQEVAHSGKRLSLEQAEQVATIVTKWAKQRGVTHFCHWFQPMTGSTAEKHDSLLVFDKNGRPIEKLGAKQLMHGEPDASSFPNGGARSTFEARGYTTWDITSPLFILEGALGKTLCIPTAFVTYHGDALDIKTPLLRSINILNRRAVKLLQLLGRKDVREVQVNLGVEQEYFLVDKALYYARPDLVMTGRTLFGPLTPKNQQLDDHYFGPIGDRVLAFMQELDYEMYRLGIPSKTRHNEVAPGQFEVAPIFQQANISNDQNLLLMHLMDKVAAKHDFVVLLHEKPFAGINGSGKHMNWSLSDNTGANLLEPGKEPQSNHNFLLMVAIIVKAVERHAKMIRMSVASAGNDHRLGANEAPPSIISVFLGDTLDRIYKAILAGEKFKSGDSEILDFKAEQLVHLLKDNTDRNRTSPFAFTGNKFEVRAVGSSQAVGFPATILNSAVADVMEEVITILERKLSAQADLAVVKSEIIRELLESSYHVVFNGDGYSAEWITEAQRRKLPNLRTTAEAVAPLADRELTCFLVEQNIFTEQEIIARYNVLVENYCALREIEFRTFSMMIDQYVVPAAITYKQQLLDILLKEQQLELASSVEREIYLKLQLNLSELIKLRNRLIEEVDGSFKSEAEKASVYANKLLPLSEDMAKLCNCLESIIPDDLWVLPTYYDMLFIR